MISTISFLLTPPLSFHMIQCYLLALLCSGRRVTCFKTFYLKKSFHFWSGRERQGPSPSRALVSIVFVLLAVQDLSIYFNHLFVWTLFGNI